MPEKPRIKIIMITAIVLMAGWSGLDGQFSNTAYHMFGFPQVNQLNPAFQPNCNGYLGMPIVSSLKFDLELPVAYSDIFTYNSTLDQFVTPLHPQGNRQVFLDAMGENNALRIEMGLPLFSTGWRRDNMFYTLDIIERMDFGFTLPGEMADFLANGADPSSTDRFSFSGFGPSMKYFHEFALGVSYNSDDEFQIGVRGKILFGLVNMKNARSDISLKTDVDEWNINSDVQYNVTVPYLDNLPIDADGTLLLDSIGNMDTDEIFGFPAHGPAAYTGWY